jgi:arginyl-tRNA synthetase
MMNMVVEERICGIIVAALEKMQISMPADRVLLLLEKPKVREHGDIAFPCFSLAKERRMAPQKIAEELVIALGDCVKAESALDSAEAAGPFVNFRISNPFLAGLLVPSIIGGEFLVNRPSKNERVVIEYSQPNTHKAFHVGHLRCASLGDTLRRLNEWQGYEVIPVNYIGDEGTHVAKCLWYLSRHNTEPCPETRKGEYLGRLYVKAVDMLDLSELSDAPIKGVFSAEVVSVEQHPSEQEWRVLGLKVAQEVRTVVTAVSDVKVGSLVAWASPGTKIGGRAVGVLDKKGIESCGMVCSPEELGLGERNDSLFEFSPGVESGRQLADIFARPGVEQPTALIQSREAEVSQVLQSLESQEGEVFNLWKETKSWSLDEFHEIYRWLDCKFDHFFFESECGDPGKSLVREFQEKGVFEESDGAIGANLRDENLGFCILIKRDGTATYACRDLALARTKFDHYRADRSIYVVDASQTLHFQQVFACLRRMGYKQAERCTHFGYALVVRPDGKMSSRKGNVVLLSQLQSMLDERVRSDFLSSYEGQWSAEEIDHASHVIALATMRYGMLKQDNNTVIVFDLDDWCSRSGNTGPYLLYAYARISSILRESTYSSDGVEDYSCLTHVTEANLLLHIREYHAALEKAAVECAPHILTSFLYELCKLFNAFYRDCAVLKAEHDALKHSRVALVDAVGRVLKHGLGLLGIPTLSRM